MREIHRLEFTTVEGRLEPGGRAIATAMGQHLCGRINALDLQASAKEGY
jgi:hypothetical protein